MGNFKLNEHYYTPKTALKKYRNKTRKMYVSCFQKFIENAGFLLKTENLHFLVNYYFAYKISHFLFAFL
ncbi:hypothetical protein FB379_13825 [Aeribacillus composti]|jgi:hypothetical protein|nr:hypothetical protein FB379_13825 [Aeribacillus composti]